MEESVFRLTVLGARGSMAICGADHAVFGGATSCYMVQAGKETVFLDAGSGLLRAPSDLPSAPAILLTHLHLDHLLGLGMYPRLSQRGKETRIYLPAADDAEAERMLDSLYAPPYWPVRMREYAGDAAVRHFSFPLRIGELTVEGLPGCHPGGCLVLRLRFGEKTLVYATDQEPDGPFVSAFAAFARDADLLLYDGQYTAGEYESHRGFGHSTAEKGVELQALCGAKRLLLIHHDPCCSDAQLLSREAAIGRGDVRFAREGDVIAL